MKKLSFLVFALFAGFLLLDGGHYFRGASAQSDNSAQKPKQEVVDSTQDERLKDKQLAALIRRLTKRTTDDLVEQHRPDGTVSVNLGEGFQNVMLSRVDEEGDVVADCITSIEEANTFFGKDLETGAPVPQKQIEKDDAATRAAAPGMSDQEYRFYKKLIENAAALRAENTNAATITIVNTDGAGEGFNDGAARTPEGNNTGTTLGQQRLNLFNFAAGIWSAFLDSNVEIRVNAQFNPLTPCTSAGGVLGSAGAIVVNSDFPGAQFPNTWYHGALSNKIAGQDLDTGFDDIQARFNTSVDNGCLGGGSRFYYGLNNSTPGGTVNLLIVLLHEMGHGLGFSSFVNGSTGAPFQGVTDIFMRNMIDRSTGLYWNQMTNAQRQTSALNNGNVLWDGPSVRIASGSLTNGRDAATGRVQLYTPTTFQGGSSISHWDTAASPSLLMEPNITVGLPLDMDLTRQQMRDIGWFRDTNADVIPDTITSVRPGNGNIQIGTNVNITWTNTGGFNRNVTIELSTNGGTTYTAIATNVANTGSFSFTVPNSPTTQGRIRVREFNFVEPAGVSAANFSISTNPTSSGGKKPFDFDGDNNTDISIYRPSNGQWWIQRSSDNVTNTFTFGVSTDKIVPEDYDGDGKTDVAIFRPATGEWLVLRSSNLTFFAAPFGIATDTPAPGDFDADGKADFAVYRPASGTWFINKTSGGVDTVPFGITGDVPVVGDYDGDGKSDVAIFRPTGGSGNGEWWLNRSSAGVFATQFGTVGDKPAVGDYTGDGKTDVAFFRPSNATWYVLRSDNLSFFAAPFGVSTDTPIPGDYDGDGKSDLAVFRSSSLTWFVTKTTGGTLIQNFGATGDTPVPSAFVR